MRDVSSLALTASLPVSAHNGGLFISRGRGQHPIRIIDSYELIFVRQGQLGMFEGEQQFTISAGQTLLLWPGRQHGGTTPYPDDLHYFWLHFALRGGGGEATAVIDAPQVSTLRQPEHLLQLFRWFLDTQEDGSLTPFSGDLLLVQMLYAVAHSLTAPHYTPSSAAMVLAQRAESYICQHFHLPISTGEIAYALDCNADYLGRIFHRIYGTTVTSALNRRRLRMACTLLLDSDLTITAIAQQCGFTDPAYFRRIFLRQQGMSPRVYRQLYARLHVNTL